MSIMADWGCAGEERRAGALRGRRTRYTQPSLLARASPSPGARAEGLPVTSLRSRPHRPSWYRFVPLPSRSDDFRCGTTSAGAVSGGLGCARPAQPSFVAPRPTQVVGESCVCQTAAGVNGTVGVRGRLFGEAEGAKRPVTMRAMPGTAGRIASQESAPGQSQPGIAGNGATPSANLRFGVSEFRPASTRTRAIPAAPRCRALVARRWHPLADSLPQALLITPHAHSTAARGVTGEQASILGTTSAVLLGKAALRTQRPINWCSTRASLFEPCMSSVQRGTWSPGEALARWAAGLALSEPDAATRPSLTVMTDGGTVSRPPPNAAPPARPARLPVPPAHVVRLARGEGKPAGVVGRERPSGVCLCCNDSCFAVPLLLPFAAASRTGSHDNPGRHKDSKRHRGACRGWFGGRLGVDGRCCRRGKGERRHALAVVVLRELLHRSCRPQAHCMRGTVSHCKTQRVRWPPGGCGGSAGAVIRPQPRHLACPRRGSIPRDPLGRALRRVCLVGSCPGSVP